MPNDARRPAPRRRGGVRPSGARRRSEVGGPSARRQKAGLPPGTVVHTGTRYMDRPRLDVISWAGEELVEERDVSLERALAHLAEARAAGRTSWLDVVGLHDTELIERLGASFSLHPLTLEDVASVGQRPKFEAYDGYLVLVARMLALSDPQDGEGVRLDAVDGVLLLRAADHRRGDGGQQ